MNVMLGFLVVCVGVGLLPGRFGAGRQAAIVILAGVMAALYLLIPRLI